MNGPRPQLWEWLVVGALCASICGSLFLLSPQAQDPSYHDFADQQTLLGVPHFWNVVSNLPFLAIGVAGLWFLLRDGGFGPGRRFLSSQEKLPFLVFFLGVGLTGFGSSYYHLAPSNERLLWDRPPMAVGFMGLFAAVLGERTRPKAGIALLGPLLLLGVGSVLYWHWTEMHGIGNLRPYLAVQFIPMVLIPLLLLFTPARYSRGLDYLIGLVWYAAAKGLEQIDREVYAILGGVGGHPIKHVLAALSAYWVLRMLLLREPLSVRNGAVNPPAV